jgi:hypothetical protein
MKMLRANLPTLLAGLALACGGSVFSRGNDDGGAAGAGASASTGGQGVGGPSGGSTSKAGAAVSGGSAPIAGSIGVAGSVAAGGAPTCADIACALPLCADGAKPVTLPGACCPSCPGPKQGCEDVKCEPVGECADGYVLSFPAGACCPGCLPKEPASVACIEIACPQTPCQPGYVRGDVLGACCHECLPDPLYCTSASDCVMADKPRSCCGCPEAITRRQFDGEPCWSEVGKPRMVPQSCYPQVTCDALCGACPEPEPVACRGQRCVAGQLGLK